MCGRKYLAVRDRVVNCARPGQRCYCTSYVAGNVLNKEPCLRKSNEL